MMGRPTTIPEPWRSLAARLGGLQALASALHSDPRTVTRWAAGDREPRGPALALIRALFRQHQIPPP